MLFPYKTVSKIVVGLFAAGISIASAAVGATWQAALWKTGIESHLNAIDATLSQIQLRESGQDIRLDRLMIQLAEQEKR